MKIAYLSTFYPFRGGIAQFNASIYNILKQDHEVNAYTFKRQYPNFLFPGETQYVTEKDNADVIKSFEYLDTVNPFSYYSTARKIKQFEPDLLIMKYWMSFFGPSLGTVAKKLKNKTKVITVLDNVIPHEKRFFDKAFTKYFLKQNHAFIAMSNKVKEDLLSLRPNAKVIVKPHPLYDHFGEKINKTEARKELGLDTEKKTILFFGFIRDYKGLDLLIDAFSKLNNEYQLVIAGESYGSFSKYEQLIDKLPNKDQVYKFVKYINDFEVPKFFSAADLCVLPYKSATQSGITSISYHFEVPILATNVGGLKESIIQGETGLIIDYPESSVIAETIKSFFENKENLSTYESKIRDYKKELSWESFSKQIIDLYKEIE